MQIINGIFLNFILIPHMESFYHINDARKTCFTAYPNLVTESQKDAKTCDFWGKSHINFEVLCEEHSYMFVDFFDKNLIRMHAKDLTTYLATEMRNCLPTLFFFELFLMYYQSSTCFEHGSP